MRRRLSGDQAPPHLTRFTPQEWPGRSWDDRFRLWKAARRMHFEQHGWPGGAVEVVRGAVDVRRHHYRLPLFPRGPAPAGIWAERDAQPDAAGDAAAEG